MKTQDLITSLGANLTATTAVPMALFVLRTVAWGIAGSILIFVVFWGIRPEVGTILRDPDLFLKSALPLLLGVFAVAWVLAQLRPGGVFRGKRVLLGLLLVLASVVSIALVQTPSPNWQVNMVGQSILTCLGSIPTLSAPILVVTLLALRRAAPEHPTRCGAVAGLMAAGFGAAIYSFYCTEDSPLFYGLWYSLAIVLVTMTGAVAGRRVLAW